MLSSFETENIEIEEKLTLKRSDLKAVEKVISCPKSLNLFSPNISLPHTKPTEELLNYLDNKIARFARTAEGQNKYVDILNEKYLRKYFDDEKNKSSPIFNCNNKFYCKDDKNYKSNYEFDMNFYKVIERMERPDKENFNLFINDLINTAISLVYDELLKFKQWVLDSFNKKMLDKTKALYEPEIFGIQLVLCILSAIASSYRFLNINTPHYHVYQTLPLFAEKIATTRKNIEDRYVSIAKKYFINDTLYPRNLEEKLFFNFSKQLLDKTFKALTDLKGIKALCCEKAVLLQSELDLADSIYTIKFYNIKLYESSIQLFIRKLNSQKEYTLPEEKLIEWTKEKALFLKIAINYYIEKNSIQRDTIFSKKIINIISKNLESDAAIKTDPSWIKNAIKLAKTMKDYENEFKQIFDPSTAAFFATYSETCIHKFNQRVPPQEIIPSLRKTLDFAKELAILDYQIKRLFDEKEQEFISSKSYEFLNNRLRKKSTYFHQLTETPNTITLDHLNEIIELTNLPNTLNELLSAGKSNHIETPSMQNAKKQLYMCSLELATDILKRSPSPERAADFELLCETLELCAAAINQKTKTYWSVKTLEIQAEKIPGKSNRWRQLAGAVCAVAAALAFFIGMALAVPTFGTSTAIGFYCGCSLATAAGLCLFVSGTQRGLSKQVNMVASEVKKLSR